jgi:hypothetical protein
MVFCPKCHVSLPENAKFCPQCGTNVDIPLAACPACAQYNPADAPYCYTCFAPMKPLAIPPQYIAPKSPYLFDNTSQLEEQIKNIFFEYLKKIAAWIAPSKLELYIKSVFQNGFSDTLDVRAKQLAETAQLDYQKIKNTPSVQSVEKQLENAIQSLALYHIVHNCKDINDLYIPEKILRYEKLIQNKAEINNLIFDYLDFENEKIRVYTNYLTLSKTSLDNAAKHYLHTAKDEIPLFICDTTILGNGKDGFAITPFGLYWKQPLGKPQKVYFHHLARLERDKKWIKINNRFFDATSSMNVKMLLLLEKLKNIYTR